jgi:hypothetical protein
LINLLGFWIPQASGRTRHPNSPRKLFGRKLLTILAKKFTPAKEKGARVPTGHTLMWLGCNSA